MSVRCAKSTRELCQSFKCVDAFYFIACMDFYFLSFYLCGFQVEAVRLIAEGKAPRITQTEEGATYECIQKKDNSKVEGASSPKSQNMSGLDVEGLG